MDYALLVQEKILRDPNAINVAVAAVVPRRNEPDYRDFYPDYFSSETFWPSEKLWEFIGVPFAVATLAIQDVAKEFRDRLKGGLRELLPDVKPGHASRSTRRG